MTLPASLRAMQRQSPRLRGILIGIEGGANTGKTELCWSAPGPAIHDALDRGYRSALENQNPPESRNLWEGENLVIRPVNTPLNSDGTTKEQAMTIWTDFVRNHYIVGLENKESRTYILDGDTQAWDLQFLAEFGRTNQIPQLNRAPIKAVKRALIARAYDSGKFVISTSMVKKRYETVYDAAGQPIPDPEKPGQFKRDWDGVSYQRAGFDEYEYCYELQLRTLYDATRDTDKFGVMILMCKANRDLEGSTLWGAEANLPIVLQSAYPHIDLSEWGY